MLEENKNQILNKKAGRKYSMGMIFAILVVSMYAISPLAPIYGKILLETGSILVTLYAIYNGGNVGNKWVTFKKESKKNGANSD